MVGNIIAVCVGCGKKVGETDIEGSLKHPYCKKCFKEKWKDNYVAYLKWLRRTHRG